MVFSNPWMLLFVVGKNLIINGVDIYNTIDAAIKAFHKSKYFDFGKYSGQSMSMVFLKMVAPDN